MKPHLKLIHVIKCTLLVLFIFNIFLGANGSAFSEGDVIPEDARLTNLSLYNESAIAYEQTTQQLYVFQLSDGAVQTYPVWNDDGVDVWHEAIPFTNGRDLLWAIEAEYESFDDYLTLTGAELCQWHIEGNTLVRSKLMDIDLFDIVEDGGFQEQLPQFCGTILSDGVCYMLMQRENGACKLYCLTADGSLSALPIEDVSALLYADDEEIMYARAVDGASKLEVYHMETGKSEVLLETQTDLSRSCYSAEEHALYYISDAVYKVDVSEPDDSETVGACPNVTCGGIIVSNDRMVFFGRDQVTIRDMNDIDLVQSLNVAGLLGDMSLYSEEHPSVMLRQTGYLSGHEITSNMLTHSSDVDIYIFQMDDTQSYEALRDRGYCLPLTHPSVAELTDGFYEEIRAEVLDGEGNICALPTSCSTGIAFDVDTALWKGLGFGDIPQTWDSFFDFLETDWLVYSRENADVRLLPYSNADDTLSSIFFMLKADYENYRDRSDAEVGYSSPVYQALLERLLSIDFDAFQYNKDAMRCLMRDSYSPRPSDITVGLQGDYMPLSIVDGVSSQIVIFPVMAFINPYSRNQEAAQELMGFLAEHRGRELKIMFQPDSNTAVKSDDYDETVEMYNENIAHLKALYETSEEIDKPQIQQDIASCEAEMEEYMNDGGYVISPDAIAQYRKLISENGLSVRYLNETTDSFNLVYELSEQLMQGQISVERYTAELDRIIVREELENQ